MLNEVYTIEQKDDHESKKPACSGHLNFGQSILTLNTVKQFQGQKNGTLMIDKYVADIPCTEKDAFVRNWVEFHEKHILCNKDAFQLSPVLDSCVSKYTETSPVFGKRRKRINQKNSLNDVVIDNSDQVQSSTLQSAIKKEISNPSVEHNKRIRINGSNSKENIKKNLFNVPTITAYLETFDVSASPVFNRKRRKRMEIKNSRRKVLEHLENKVIDTPTTPTSIDREVYGQKISPVLSKNSYYSNIRKRRKPSNKTVNQTFLDKVQNSYIDSNMNSMEFYNLMDNQSMETELKIMCTQKLQMLIKKLKDNLNDNDDDDDDDDDGLKSFARKDSKISSENLFAASDAKLCIENSPKDVKDIVEMETESSSQNDTKLHIEDSPKDAADTVKIEIESSNLNDDNSNNDIVITSSDSDKDLSDQIEDTDAQNANSTTNNANHKPKPNFYLVTSNTDFVNSQMSKKDSDQTYCEEAEQLRCAEAHSLQKISQVSTQINDSSDPKSSQSRIVISTETSPGKTYPNQSVQLSLLDSGKKRKKPKRGSLSERLQSTINRQISFVRIWRYQLKQIDKDNISVPYVTVYVQACITRYSRQFLEGIVIEDSFSLLSSKERNESSKFIKIMTIPNIVGRVEMKSNGMVQIFPPWDVLDGTKLILHVTYIRVLPDNEKIMEGVKNSTHCVKKMNVKRFSCQCIDANTMIPSCTDRCNKPNVIEQLFSS